MGKDMDGGDVVELGGGKKKLVDGRGQEKGWREEEKWKGEEGREGKKKKKTGKLRKEERARREGGEGIGRGRGKKKKKKSRRKEGIKIGFWNVAGIKEKDKEFLGEN